VIQRLISVFGIFALLGIAWLLSNNKKQINFRAIFWGIGLQLLFALIILKTGLGNAIFFFAEVFITKLLSFTYAGASFLFGNLYFGDSGIIEATGHDGPYQLWNPQNNQYLNIGIIFAFHILPTIIFFASFMSIMYHLGIMQRIVQFMAWIMTKTIGTSGAESLSAGGNIFVGQTEAPLLVKPYINDKTCSELMAIMTGGFANFSSIAIQIGGIGGIAPTRRGDLARIGLRAMFAGALASWMTAAIAGILI
jgi:CNT family concentrative nucleoside transporter